MSGYKGNKQKSGIATYFKIGCPHNGVINSEWTEEEIDRFIRAMIYPPLPYATFKDKEIQCLKDYLKIKKDE